MEELLFKNLEHPAKFLILTQKHIIVGMQSTYVKLEFLFKYDEQNLQDDDLKPFELDKFY